MAMELSLPQETRWVGGCQRVWKGVMMGRICGETNWWWCPTLCSWCTEIAWQNKQATGEITENSRSCKEREETRFLLHLSSSPRIWTSFSRCLLCFAAFWTFSEERQTAHWHRRTNVLLEKVKDTGHVRSRLWSWCERKKQWSTRQYGFESSVKLQLSYTVLIP